MCSTLRGCILRGFPQSLWQKMCSSPTHASPWHPDLFLLPITVVPFHWETTYPMSHHMWGGVGVVHMSNIFLCLGLVQDMPMPCGLSQGKALQLWAPWPAWWSARMFAIACMLPWERLLVGRGEWIVHASFSRWVRTGWHSRSSALAPRVHSCWCTPDVYPWIW